MIVVLENNIHARNMSSRSNFNQYLSKPWADTLAGRTRSDHQFREKLCQPVRRDLSCKKDHGLAS